MNAGIRYQVLIIFIALFSCKPNAAKIEELPVSVITGETSLPVKDDIQLPPLAFTPDIDPLREPGDTAAIRMVALGGSFAAGKRNGGLYRESQMTSIPELIAHQMQLASFISPLFDKAQGNGSGYLIYDRQAELPSWKRVTNQTAIVSHTPLIYAPFKGSRVDNISWPEGPGTNSDSTNSYFYYPGGKTPYFSYLSRFYTVKGPNETPFNYFTNTINKKTHLLLHFEDLDSWIGWASYTKNLRTQDRLNEAYFYPRREFIKYNLEQGTKMVLYNYPDFLDFPYFHLYSAKQLLLKNNTSGQILTESTLLIPTSHIKKAFSGNQKEVTLDEDVISIEEANQFRIVIKDILNTNTVQHFADLYNIPVVDMYSIYKTILAGKYFTKDGLFIDPAFPDGNFFSDDGIHPTAIGSAVIANETINKINERYKTRIPLINVSELAKRL
jgi:hypothetical protein